MKRRPIFIFIPIAIFFAIGGIVMLLWNWLIPAIFGLEEISYFQALGLFLLSRILLGSLGWGNKRPPFANPKFREKMMNMTDEERQLFKEEWKSRCNR
jgi:hypothetical protein